MAKIEIASAFVEPWNKNQPAHPAWGMKTAEPHSKKNDAGGYDTISRTFRTVKVSRESGIDLTQFGQGARVQVWGREVTEVREHEGKKYYDLVVWADRVELLQGSQQAQQPQGGGWPGDVGQGSPQGVNGAQGGFQGSGSFDDEQPF